MTPRRFWLCCLVVGSVVAVLQPGCASHEDVWKGTADPRIVVTFAPLASFVKAVGGNHVAVICLCTNKGPHDYEYNVKDIIALRQADLFLANGLELDEKFADKLHLNVNNPKLRYIKLGEELTEADLLPMREGEDKHEEKAGHDHKHDHKHGDHDPHVWLGIKQAKKMVEKISEALQKAAPNHAEEYHHNADKYLASLDALKKKGEAMVAGKKLKLVTFHESLGYSRPHLRPGRSWT